MKEKLIFFYSPTKSSVSYNVIENNDEDYKIVIVKVLINFESIVIIPVQILIKTEKSHRT